MSLMKLAVDEFLRPLVQRPCLLQVAALCVRGSESGPEILLVTSRGRGRWIIPKGWPEAGMDAVSAARREAWEEAGVTAGPAASAPFARYRTVKRRESGLEEPCEMLVFRFDVTSVASEFPEKGQRQITWASPAAAAELVDEPGLRDILRRVGAPAAASSRAE